MEPGTIFANTPILQGPDDHFPNLKRNCAGVSSEGTPCLYAVILSLLSIGRK